MRAALPSSALCGIVVLALACGEGEPAPPQTVAASPRQGPQPAAAPQTTDGAKSGGGAIWVDGTVLESTENHTILQQGNVALVEIVGRPVLFVPAGPDVWENVGRLPRAGEKVCMSGALTDDGRIIAGKMFTPALCGVNGLEE